MKNNEISKAAAIIGRLGGLAKTNAKKKASAKNGKLGGRPKKKVKGIQKDNKK